MQDGTMSSEPSVEEVEAEVVEHVTVEHARGDAHPDVVATTVPPGGVQPSSFMTRWRVGQWLVALLALLLPLGLMAGIVYVFRDYLRRVAESVGF
jgi:hypothetical protein